MPRACGAGVDQRGQGVLGGRGRRGRATTGQVFGLPRGKASGEEGLQTPLSPTAGGERGAGRVQKEEMAAGGGAVYPGVREEGHAGFSPGTWAGRGTGQPGGAGERGRGKRVIAGCIDCIVISGRGVRWFSSFTPG